MTSEIFLLMLLQSSGNDRADHIASLFDLPAIMKLSIQPIQLLLVTGTLLFALRPTACDAAYAYMRSTVGAPWGQSTNETAMNTVFGAGNWSDLRYETTTAASLFTVGTNFVFMEGSDNNADELESYLTVNLATIQNWVSNGGSLFINAAPNEGNGMSFGFGVVNNYPAGSSTATAVNPSHPIFLGPHGATGTSFTGNSFSHASVSGSLTPLITGTSGTILGEAAFGSGHLLFGGMTTNNWHSPAFEAASLRANIIAYGAAQAIPEPSVALLGSLGLFALLRRRRQIVS